MTDKEEVMKETKRLMGRLTALALTLLVLALAGCGGSGSTSSPPAALTGVTATAGDTQVNVNWTPVAGVASYNIYYATTAAVTTASPTKVTGATGSQAVINLTNGTLYHFVVTAVSDAGESAVSNEVSATPVPPVPVKPSGISVSGGDAKATISWTPVSGATSYNVYYAAGGIFANATKITDATSGNLTAPLLKVVEPLVNDTAYSFWVTAVNLGGESDLSSVKTATPAVAPQAPTSPSNVRAVAGPAGGQVTVTWGTVTAATSYNVYYLQSTAAISALPALSTWTKASSLSSPLVISNLTGGAGYYFSVTAVNAVGESVGQANPKPATPSIP
jgi:fibronectin type 3 domain-containing protein